MVSVEVIVPWRPSPDREPLLRWVLTMWGKHHPDWPVTLAWESGEGLWVKANAVNPAVARSEADLIVVADADVWSHSVHLAVEQVKSWAVPHGLVCRLSKRATELVVGDGLPFELAHQEAGLDQHPYWGVAGGGIVVARRDVLLDVPFDPRFEGWGGEDHALGYALGTLYGPAWRGDTPLFHLWHPPEPRRTRRHGNRRSEQLRRRYRDARVFQADMRAVVDEAKELAWRDCESS